MGFFGKDKEEEVKEKVEDIEETEDEVEETEDDKTYEAELTCENCGDSDCYEVEFGVPIREYLQEEKCAICGCYLFQE